MPAREATAADATNLATFWQEQRANVRERSVAATPAMLSDMLASGVRVIVDAQNRGLLAFRVVDGSCQIVWWTAGQPRSIPLMFKQLGLTGVAEGWSKIWGYVWSAQTGIVAYLNKRPFKATHLRPDDAAIVALCGMKPPTPAQLSSLPHYILYESDPANVEVQA